MSEISNWMFVDAFTVDQAAALWCEIDPTDILSGAKRSEIGAIKQMLTAAILAGEIGVDDSHNPFRSIGDHSSSIVRRTVLEAYAKNRNLYPRFLFDTLAPFAEAEPAWMPAIKKPLKASEQPVPLNRGGRPQEYDWDTFLLEIIRKANTPDGLPDKQADLVKDMLFWFQETYSNEPAESAVKARISKIYRYLAEAKNQPK